MARIVLENVSAVFPIYSRPSRSLRNRVFAATTGGRIGKDRRKKTVVRALDDISLTIEHGDRVALMGANGAGKSTLLRVMSGIYEPISGRIVREGRVAPLFNASLGMEREDTGYENIVNRGLFMGLRRDEIEARVDEIAEFTGLGEYLNMPIHTYSAGMRTRLAFAVCTSIEPDILLLDEGIGTGDAAFVQRANERMKKMIEVTGILVLASHSLGLLRRMCTTAIWMEAGKIVERGPLEDIIAGYYKSHNIPAGADDIDEAETLAT